MNDVEISYSLVKYNGSLMKENIFRQSADPEVDAAWEGLGVDCVYILTSRVGIID